MSPFNLKDFLHHSESTWSVFQEIEKKQFPENDLLLLSPVEINRGFKHGLDEIKTEQGFIPKEVYVSTKPSRAFSANFGKTLLELEVVFRLPLDVRRLSRKARNKGRDFPFEQRVKEEYERCLDRFQQIKQELETSWRARDLPASDLEQAIESTKDAYRDALTQYSAFKRNNASADAIRQSEAEVGNLGVLLNRLKGLNPKRA